MQTGGLDPAYPVGAFGGITPGYTGPGSVPMPPRAGPFQGGTGGTFQSLIPPMGMPSYNPGGGYMPAPIGGQWNQIAQQMAGPMFMPQGTSILGGQSNPIAPQQPSGVTVPPSVGLPTPITSRLPTPPTSGPYAFNPGQPPGAPSAPKPVGPTLPVAPRLIGGGTGLAALGGTPPQSFGGGGVNTSLAWTNPALRLRVL